MAQCYYSTHPIAGDCWNIRSSDQDPGSRWCRTNSNSFCHPEIPLCERNSQLAAQNSYSTVTPCVDNYSALKSAFGWFSLIHFGSGVVQNSYCFIFTPILFCNSCPVWTSPILAFHYLCAWLQQCKSTGPRLWLYL